MAAARADAATSVLDTMLPNGVPADATLDFTSLTNMMRRDASYDTALATLNQCRETVADYRMKLCLALLADGGIAPEPPVE